MLSGGYYKNHISYMFSFYCFILLLIFSCYLSLGEMENASQHFMTCLEMGSKSCVERKVLVEASEGLEKALVNNTSNFNLVLLRNYIKDFLCMLLVTWCTDC